MAPSQSLLCLGTERQEEEGEFRKEGQHLNIWVHATKFALPEVGLWLFLSLLNVCRQQNYCHQPREQLWDSIVWGVSELFNTLT